MKQRQTPTAAQYLARADGRELAAACQSEVSLEEEPPTELSCAGAASPGMSFEPTVQRRDPRPDDTLTTGPPRR